jgi:hypothetical protein
MIIVLPFAEIPCRMSFDTSLARAGPLLLLLARCSMLDARTDGPTLGATHPATAQRHEAAAAMSVRAARP